MIYSSAIKNVGWGVAIPHEINNQFLGAIDRLSINKKVPYDFSLLGLADFGDVKIDFEQVDKYLLQLSVLEKNIADIIKYCPLPKSIWGFDRRMYPNFILSSNVDEIDIDKNGVPFFKEEMILFINQLIKLAREAKQNGCGLQFLGD